ncbi:aspartate/glutamate racemase family protein [Bradyrhizobium sp. 5.13L]
MASKISPSLGILNLEQGLTPGAPLRTPRAHSILNPTSYDFPVILETVAGAWAEIVIRGDPALEPAYISGAQRLVERGAVVITANCGFSIRHQAAVAASVKVPVVTSSLLLLPTLLRQLPKAAKVAVLTADSTHLGEDLLGIDDPTDRTRVVIGGIEGGEMWHNEMKRPPPHTDVGVIESEVAECVARLRNEHPAIAAILFECTAFPLVAPAMRRMTKLPIYDITTLCRLTLASVA